MKDKHIHKFTITIISLALFIFFVYWSYKFGIFNPSKGTSSASISALWGQFLVSLLATIALSVVLFITDLRQKPTHIFKLVSLYVLIVTIAFVGYLFWRDRNDYGRTHTFKVGQEFDYLNYKFTVDPKTEDIKPEDCSTLSTTYASNTLGWWSKYEGKGPRQDCEQENTRINGQKKASVKVMVGNTLDEFKYFSPDWFELTSSTGKTYQLTFANNGGFYQVPPNGQITASLTTKNGFLSKDETIYSIKIKIDNHAEQVVKP